MKIQVGGHYKNNIAVFADIDDVDYELVNNYTWSKSPGKNTTYAMAHTPDGTIQLHRLIMNPIDGQFINHINGNGLDNRRANLELSNPLHNGQSIRQVKSSRNIGSIHNDIRQKKNPYRASVIINKIRYNKGFMTKSEAQIWINQMIAEKINSHT